MGDTASQITAKFNIFEPSQSRNRIHHGKSSFVHRNDWSLDLILPKWGLFGRVLSVMTQNVMFDDAYIIYRFAPNLAHGFAFSYNSGAPTRSSGELRRRIPDRSLTAGGGTLRALKTAARGKRDKPRT